MSPTELRTVAVTLSGNFPLRRRMRSSCFESFSVTDTSPLAPTRNGLVPMKTWAFRDVTTFLRVLKTTFPLSPGVARKAYLNPPFLEMLTVRLAPLRFGLVGEIDVRSKGCRDEGGGGDEGGDGGAGSGGVTDPGPIGGTAVGAIGDSNPSDRSGVP